MNVTAKDIKALWRSPVMWSVLALISFVFAWMVWQMLDKYVSLQLDFLALPNPPNITEVLWVPVLLLLAKLTMLLVALTAGVSLAQERAQNTLWYLLINNSSMARMIWNKFKAQLILLLYVFMQLIVVAMLFEVGGQLQWLVVLSGMLGMALFVMWLIACGMMISAFCQSTGTAVLLNLVVFVLFWLMGVDGIGQEYGLNWLSLVSPVHHLQWFCEAQISLSSMIYFLFGIWVFLWVASHKIAELK